MHKELHLNYYECVGQMCGISWITGSCPILRSGNCTVSRKESLFKVDFFIWTLNDISIHHKAQILNIVQTADSHLTWQPAYIT